MDFGVDYELDKTGEHDSLLSPRELLRTLRDIAHLPFDRQYRAAHGYWIPPRACPACHFGNDEHAPFCRLGDTIRELEQLLETVPE